MRVSFSGIIASFYNSPELADCLRVYAIYLLIASLGIVQYVRLNKELRFKVMALTSLIANVAGLSVAVFVALKGGGYWALIAQHLTFIFVRALLQTLYTRYLPHIGFSLSSFKELFSFGGSIMLSGILNVVYTNIASSIIPKVGTIRQNGLYLQASRIQQVPLNVLSAISDKVLFPVLCKQSDEDIVVTSRGYMRKILLLVSLILCLCVFLSHPLVKLVLGEKWIETADYLQVLFFASYGLCHQYLGRTLLKSIGKTKKILQIDFCKSVFGLLVLSVAAVFGIYALLWGMVGISIVISFFFIYFLHYTGYKSTQQIRDLYPSCAIVLACFLIYFFSKS